MTAKRGNAGVCFCAKAAEEQDPEKLLKLIEDINNMLDAKEQRPLKMGQEKFVAQ